MTGRDPKEGANILLKLLFLGRRPVLRKNKEHYEKEEKSKNVLYFILGCTGWQNTPPKSAVCQFTKLAGLTVRNPTEQAKIILKLLFLSGRRVLIKNKRALSNTENERK